MIPPGGEKGREGREAAVILPALLSDLEVREMIPLGSQWRDRPG